MTTAQNNVPMPLFAKASNTQGDSWNDVDNFDVEMLAEYLLGDGNVGLGGVTFDFNMENSQQGSCMVSPENSEDGNLPPVADVNTAMVQHISASKAAVPVTNGAPQQLSSSSIPNQSQEVHSILFQQQQQPPKPIHGVGPIVAVASASPISTAMSGQQLVAAASQVMQGRGRKKSQAQIDRRRERNRILARRTRLRKKFFFESLQKEILDLQRENQVLKDIVKMNIGGEESQKILSGCDAVDKIPEGVFEACGENMDLDDKDFNLVRSIQRSQHAFLITDPSLQDNPIVFASDDFLRLTGYNREEVLGRNCRFLQGSLSHHTKVDEIRKALSLGDDVNVTIANYTADGTPFWNNLFIAALRDAQNNIVNFIGVIVKVASPGPGDLEYGVSLEDSAQDLDDEAQMAAESAVEAIEGAVSAAVAAASGCI